MHTYLVVNVNTVKVELFHPCGHFRAESRRVLPVSGGGISGTERRDHQRDAMGLVVCLVCAALFGRELRPCVGLVCRAGREEER